MRVVFLSLLFFFAIEHSLGTKQWPNPLPNEVKPNQTNGLQKPTNPTDKAALEEFYHSTAGPAWLKSNGWLAGDPCQSMWYGIRCNSMGDVVEIALGNNQLAGELPDVLSSMKSLTALILHHNTISGTLPQSLFTIKSLKAMDLRYNKLSGSFPSELALPYLTNLSMSNNELQGFLPSRWNCPNLEVISLSSNMLQGPLPNSLSTLSKLRYLDVSQNYFTGSFPSEYSSLVSLEIVWLFTNRFDDAAIPESWNKLVKMKNFQADSVTGDLPQLIGVNWSDLEVLIIVDGQLTGSIPESFCHLKRLRYLHLFRNSITGPLPKCLCDMPASPIISINLSYNQITGTIPDCFDNFADLRYFYMENNNLTGSLPHSLSTCKQLSTIDLSNNFLVGSIPALYANLKDTLNWFELDNNRLNAIEDGLEDFIITLSTKFCSFYGNPWSCPLPDYFGDKEYCTTRCSSCNTLEQHSSCEKCLASKSNCGWCAEGPNCLEGYTDGPYYPYKCVEWKFGNKTSC